MGFEGYFTCCNGKVIEEVCVDSYNKADGVADDIDFIYEEAIERTNNEEEEINV
jgi:hypothetical protein